MAHFQKLPSSASQAGVHAAPEGEAHQGADEVGWELQGGGSQQVVRGTARTQGRIAGGFL